MNKYELLSGLYWDIGECLLTIGDVIESSLSGWNLDKDKIKAKLLEEVNDYYEGDYIIEDVEIKSIIEQSYYLYPIDDDGKGTVKKINCQFQAASSGVGAGSPWMAKVIPANFYSAQDGNIYLDVEKAADDSSTRTGSIINMPNIYGNWSA